jgi:hypothetical protein
MDATTSFYGSGDAAAFREKVERLANSGDVNAQIVMAGAYTPPECTYLPFKTAPADCPTDLKPTNPFGVTNSFDLAFHWLKLASDQGNGEATEMLAQLTERAIRFSALPNETMADVARLHALARSQGFDLQDVEYTCYSLDPVPGADTLTLETKAPAEATLSSEELAQLHTAGVSGKLRWQVICIQPNMTVALHHPEGPKVHLRIIVSSAMTREVKVPLPNRTDVIYLQQADRVVTFPTIYPAMLRSLAFRPSTAREPGGAFFQGIDGHFSSICPSPARP